jgi:hypothetical protein
MTDRINAFIVILDENLISDSGEPLLTALRQLKGVLEVKPHTATVDSMVAESRVRAEITKQLFDLAVQFSKR